MCVCFLNDCTLWFRWLKVQIEFMKLIRICLLFLDVCENTQIYVNLRVYGWFEVKFKLYIWAEYMVSQLKCMIWYVHEICDDVLEKLCDYVLDFCIELMIF